MKAILENYASNLTTEPLYFSECLNRIGSQGMLWNPAELSIYDAYDVMNPDLIVVTLGSISLDIFKLLKNSPTKLVVNISGCPKDQVELLCEAIKTNKIDCPFIFGDTSPNDIVGGIRHVNILKGADIFLKYQNNTLPDYAIDAAFIVDSEEEEIGFEGSYHVLSQDESIKADIHFPINSFYALCGNYKEIFIKHSVDNVLSQVFFDAHLYGNKITIDPVGGESQSVTDMLLDKFGSDVKKSVGSKHLCTHRVSRFLRKLGLKEEAKNVEKIEE